MPWRRLFIEELCLPAAVTGPRERRCRMCGISDFLSLGRGSRRLPMWGSNSLSRGDGVRGDA
jgi:hypothetical protein